MTTRYSICKVYVVTWKGYKKCNWKHMPFYLILHKYAQYSFLFSAVIILFVMINQTLASN